MAYLLKRIGDETFIDYLHRFGFGKPTGIDLPNEAKGIIANSGPVERVTTTYGQGSTVTANANGSRYDCYCKQR